MAVIVVRLAIAALAAPSLACPIVPKRPVPDVVLMMRPLGSPPPLATARQ
jgi:hypothetical protein